MANRHNNQMIGLLNQYSNYGHAQAEYEREMQMQMMRQLGPSQGLIGDGRATKPAEPDPVLLLLTD